MYKVWCRFRTCAESVTDRSLPSRRAVDAGGDVAKGHLLAITLCAICYVAAPDQPYEPVMKPPAPSFASIVRRKKYDAEMLTDLLKTTHRGLDNPTGMPSAELMDYQIKQ